MKVLRIRLFVWYYNHFLLFINIFQSRVNKQIFMAHKFRLETSSKTEEAHSETNRAQ